jgi:hypothetical protein
VALQLRDALGHDLWSVGFNVHVDNDWAAQEKPKA